MSTTIRQLSSDDLDAYLALRREAVVESPHSFLESLEDVDALPREEHLRRLQHGAMFGAYDEDTLVGMVGYAVQSGSRVAHRGYVHGMYVSPKERGKGMASRLLATLIAHAKQHGLECLDLSVESGSGAVIALYEKIGFTIYGRYPHIMKMPDGSYIDDLYMWMDLKLS